MWHRANGLFCDGLQFKEISKAYEVLSDTQKKELYDQYGMEGVEAGGPPGGGGFGGGADLFDILSGLVLS